MCIGPQSQLQTYSTSSFRHFGLNGYLSRGHLYMWDIVEFPCIRIVEYSLDAFMGGLRAARTS